MGEDMNEQDPNNDVESEPLVQAVLPGFDVEVLEGQCIRVFGRMLTFSEGRMLADDITRASKIAAVLSGEEISRDVQWHRIAQVVALEFQVSIETLMNGGRDGTTATARHVLMWAISVSFDGASQRQIGQWLGRERTTVLHGIQQVRSKRKDDPEFKERTDTILQDAGYAEPSSDPE